MIQKNSSWLCKNVLLWNVWMATKRNVQTFTSLLQQSEPFQFLVVDDEKQHEKNKRKIFDPTGNVCCVRSMR
jgi:hypothetical protein